jgi:hypothetical protein
LACIGQQEYPIDGGYSFQPSNLGGPSTLSQLSCASAALCVGEENATAHTIYRTS